MLPEFVERPRDDRLHRRRAARRDAGDRRRRRADGLRRVRLGRRRRGVRARRAAARSSARAAGAASSRCPTARRIRPCSVPCGQIDARLPARRRRSESGLIGARTRRVQNARRERRSGSASARRGRATRWSWWTGGSTGSRSAKTMVIGLVKTIHKRYLDGAQAAVIAKLRAEDPHADLPHRARPRRVLLVPAPRRAPADRPPVGGRRPRGDAGQRSASRRRCGWRT